MSSFQRVKGCILGFQRLRGSISSLQRFQGCIFGVQMLRGFPEVCFFGVLRFPGSVSSVEKVQGSVSGFGHLEPTFRTPAAPELGFRLPKATAIHFGCMAPFHAFSGSRAVFWASRNPRCCFCLNHADDLNNSTELNQTRFASGTPQGPSIFIRKQNLILTDVHTSDTILTRLV